MTVNLCVTVCWRKRVAKRSTFHLYTGRYASARHKKRPQTVSGAVKHISGILP